MPLQMAETFARCAEVTGTIFTSEHRGPPTDEQVKVLMDGHAVIRTLIIDLAGPKPKFAQPVQNAMADVNPKDDPQETDMLLRELSDVALTFQRLRRGKSRSDHSKIAIAVMLCQFLRDEFRSIAE